MVNVLSQEQVKKLLNEAKKVADGGKLGELKKSTLNALHRAKMIAVAAVGLSMSVAGAHAQNTSSTPQNDGVANNNIKTMYNKTTYMQEDGKVKETSLYDGDKLVATRCVYPNNDGTFRTDIKFFEKNELGVTAASFNGNTLTVVAKDDGYTYVVGERYSSSRPQVRPLDTHFGMEVTGFAYETMNKMNNAKETSAPEIAINDANKENLNALQLQFVGKGRSNG